MRQSKQHNNNKASGVALVTVLLVAAVTIALAYGALSVSTSVLRGSKGAESSVQARLNAESGLDASFVYIEDLFRKDENASSFGYIPSITPDNGPQLSFNEAYKFARVPVLVDDNITLVVNGHVSTSDTVYTTNADVYYNPGSGAITDPHASPETPQTIQDLLYRGITSCSVLETSGSGQILGAGNIYVGDNATISPGQGKLEGDIFSPKTITVGSGKVEGSVNALGSVVIDNGGAEVVGTIRGNEGVRVTEGGAKITGDIHSLGNIQLEKGGIQVTGDIYTLADLRAGSMEIVGRIFAQGEINLGNTSVKSSSAGGRTDVRSNSNIIVDNSRAINANLYSTKEVLITNHSTIINGDIFVLGNIIIQGATINGNIYAGGNVTLNQGKVSGEIHTNGSVIADSGASIGQVHTGPDVLHRLNEALTALPSPEPAPDYYGCEVQQQDFQLETEINRLNAVTSGESYPGIRADTWDRNVQWILRPDSLTKSFDGGTTEQPQPTPRLYSGQFFGQTISFYRFKDFKTLATSQIVIKGGDVTILVDDTVEIRAPSTIKIDSDSSLRIITLNKIVVQNNDGTSSDYDTINDSELPSLSFYTSYGSSTTEAFLFGSSNLTLRALVYAPNGNIKAHSATLEGGFVGKEILVSGGNGFIKYDKGLLDLIGRRGLIPVEGEEGLVIVKRR